MADPVNMAVYTRVTSFFNYKNVGWSESLDIASVSDSACMAILKAYSLHRAWTLPVGVVQVYGRITRVPRVRYSTPSTDFPLAGKAPSLTAANTNDMNDPSSALCVRFIGQEGHNSTRFFRGLPDDAVTGMVLVPSAPGGSWSDIGTVIGDGTATPATLAAAIKNLLNYVAQNSAIASGKQVIATGPPVTLGYRMRNPTGLMLRDIRKKNVGRPFGMFHGKQPIR